MKKMIMRVLGAALVIGAAVFVGRATAGPGTAGGASTSVLVWQGTLSGATTSTAFKFEFKKAGSVVCTVNTVPTKAVGDAVTVNVDYLTGTSTGTGCAGLFDGADVTVTVTAGGVSLVDQPLGPVAYAKYADRAREASSAAVATTATVAATAGRIVVTRGAGSVSANGTYCGQTPDAKNGDFKGSSTSNGYQVAKAACKAACGGSDTAHICTLDEMVRTATLGIPVPVTTSYLWLAGAIGGISTSQIDDCRGFTSSSSSDSAATWYAATGSPAPNGCNATSPIACCD